MLAVELFNKTKLPLSLTIFPNNYPPKFLKTLTRPDPRMEPTDEQLARAVNTHQTMQVRVVVPIWYV